MKKLISIILFSTIIICGFLVEASAIEDISRLDFTVSQINCEGEIKIVFPQNVECIECKTQIVTEMGRIRTIAQLKCKAYGEITENTRLYVNDKETPFTFESGNEVSNFCFQTVIYEELTPPIWVDKDSGEYIIPDVPPTEVKTQIEENSQNSKMIELILKLILNMIEKMKGFFVQN